MGGGGLTGIQFILNSNISTSNGLQGLVFITPDSDAFVCQAHVLTNSPFTFVVQMLSAGSASTVQGQQNDEFFWMVI